MLVMIEVSNNDIIYAEQILLGSNKYFDEERINFIKDFSTLDLQAVPGSGKTTALLAKLLILEKKLPLINNRAVLVISHTNTAIEEIRIRIEKYCPQLFSYPHFIGTIQGFVDMFLAIPCFTNKFKKKPYRIDNEIYSEKITNKLNSIWLYKYGNSQELINKISYLKNLNEGLFHRTRLGLNENDEIILLDKLNGNKLEIKKPRGNTRAANYIDYNDLEKSQIYKWLLKFKKDIIRTDGVLHFDDAYFLANLILSENPKYKDVIKERFKYIFIDEMQDMDFHQYGLLDKLFFNNNEGTLCFFQRIGDINQAIFNGFSDSEVIWELRENTKYINGSYRLSPNVSNVVEKLALTDNNIEGRNTNSDGSEIQIKPTLILFNNENKERVIEVFANIINEYIKNGLIPNLASNIYQAVAWRKDHPQEDKIGLKDYCPNYNQTSIKTRVDYNCLNDYIIHFDTEKRTLESIRKNIINAFLRILRIENIKDEGNYQFTERNLINYIKRQEDIVYENFKLYLYNWSLDVIKGNKNVLNSIQLYIPTFLGLFEKTIRSSEFFINAESEHQMEQEESSKIINRFNFENIEVQVGTVHSVKGQTNTSTLYLETFFERGYGNYESERLRNQILGIKVSDTLKSNVTSKEKIKKSAKMAYVGFSRPTHLLCMGIHKDRFDSCLSEIDELIWDIVEI